ncbi:MAG: hypothetical protein MJ105_04515 [Lachnospiraceae bacterium]|nr:hypothetical protein [Lachnospiraceae bacterium]
MENLLKAFRELSREEQCEEVAFLSVISNGNYARELLSKAKNAGTKAINKAAGLIKKNGVTEAEVLTQSDRIALVVEEMADMEADEIVEKCKEVIREKLTSLGYKDADILDEEIMSQRIMKEAGIAVSSEIGAEGTPYQKADDVMVAITKKDVSQFKVTISGNKLTRELLAHFIWKVTGEGKKYFPEGIAATEKELELDEQYFAAMREKVSTDEELAELDRQVLNMENKILGDISSITDLEKKLVFVDKRISEYEIEKMPEDAADFVSAKSVKKITEDELQAKKADREALTEKIERVKATKKEKLEAIEAKQQKTEALAAEIAVEVKKIFQSAFALTIYSEAIEKLCKVYSAKDREVLSSALKELAAAKEPAELADPLEKDDQKVMTFVLSKKALGRIFYICKDGNIEVTNVLKVKRS